MSERHGHRFKDRTALTYGSLTVVRFAGHNKWRQILWECVCRCGATRTAPGSQLHTGQVKNCGDCPLAGMHHAARDLHGRRFGMLTVLARIGSDPDRRIVWKCRCDCGRIVHRQSCLLTESRKGGCEDCELERQREARCGVRPAGRLEDGEASFRALGAQYRNNARVRGLEWALDSDIVRALFTGDCYYCGAEPANVYETSKRSGPFVYNGIDRKDNAIGYRPENCVSCCRICNRAKLDMPFRDFLIWARRLGAHQLRRWNG